MSRETIAVRKVRARRILTRLRRMYPDAHCALQHHADWQLLVSTILSAQSTDETVNRVTTRLFSKYHGPADLAAASQEQLERDVHATGFFRQKARNIRNACRMLMEDFGGRVPDSMDQLLRLPGVARKTANVVLGTWFGRHDGVVVDTHVGRIAQRLGLTWQARHSKDAERIEQDLMELLPRRQWTYFSHAVIWHGRRVCTARHPDCAGCALSGLCPSAFQVPGRPPAAPGRARSPRARKSGGSKP